MKLTPEQAAILVGAVGIALVLVVLSFYAGKGCRGDGPPIVIGIDAGPGEAEILDRLDAAAQETAIRLAAIEREHAEDIAAFNELQREKYDELRNNPDEADAFLRDFNRSLRSTHGEP